MAFQSVTTHHFVKSEDLNHHGTLFAGRTAEWFVESGLMAAALHLPSENIVCVKIHGSQAVLAGRSSMTVNIRVSVNGETNVDGFITYVNVDNNGKAFPHQVEISADTEEEKALQEAAKALPKK